MMIAKKLMDNEILLNKEQEKNNIDKIVCETELNNTKNNFAKQLLNGMGETINIKTIHPKPIKYSLWYKFKRYINNLFKKNIYDTTEY